MNLKKSKIPQREILDETRSLYQKINSEQHFPFGSVFGLWTSLGIYHYQKNMQMGYPQI